MGKLKDADQYAILIDKTGRDKNWYVMLLDGVYAGLIYRYVKFSLAKQPSEDGTLRYSFEHDIVRVPDHLVGVALPDSERETLANQMGEILLEILQDQLEQPAEDEEES